MSTDALVILNNQSLAVGGIGIGAPIFKGRPQSLELVYPTTKQEGAQPRKFRVIATNQHFDEMRIVMLDAPKEQREWYDGPEFSRDSKQCFSVDNIQPHPKAKNPPAMYCATCPKGDINWPKWRKTHVAADLPPCGMFYHNFIADRATQTPYYFNVKGTSVMPWKNAMETQMFGILQMVIADVKAKNKLRGYKLNSLTGLFEPDMAFVLPEGTQRALPLPMPNIFDISFTIFVTTITKGGPPVVGLKDFQLMQDEQRAEFGALYLDFAQRRADGRAAADEQLAAAAEVEAQFAKAAVSVAVPTAAVVLPGVPAEAAPVMVTVSTVKVPIVGEVLPKDAPITI